MPQPDHPTDRRLIENAPALRKRDLTPRRIAEALVAWMQDWWGVRVGGVTPIATDAGLWLEFSDLRQMHSGECYLAHVVTKISEQKIVDVDANLGDSVRIVGLYDPSKTRTETKIGEVSSTDVPLRLGTVALIGTERGVNAREAQVLSHHLPWGEMPP